MSSDNKKKIRAVEEDVDFKRQSEEEEIVAQVSSLINNMDLS
jgi:hypothetical protein